jgi:hypothetical protein
MRNVFNMILSAILIILVVKQAASNDIIKTNSQIEETNQGYKDSVSSAQQDSSKRF